MPPPEEQRTRAARRNAQQGTKRSYASPIDSHSMGNLIDMENTAALASASATAVPAADEEERIDMNADVNNNNNNIATTRTTHSHGPSMEPKRKSTDLSSSSNNSSSSTDNRKKPPPAKRLQQAAQQAPDAIPSLRRSTRSQAVRVQGHVSDEVENGGIAQNHDHDENKQDKVKEFMPKRRGTREDVEAKKTLSSETRATTHQQGASDARNDAEAMQDSSTISCLLEPYECPPLNVPETPPNVKGTWSFDEKTRVLLADFRDVEKITPVEKEHLLKMMERDDISVVSWGLIDPIRLNDDDDDDYYLDSIADDMSNDTPYHKFRRFDRVTEENGESYYKEIGFHSLYFEDFRNYLKLKVKTPLMPFDFVDRSTNQLVRFDKAGDVALYMIDVEMEKYLPTLDTDYKEIFKIKEIIPGGAFCMMSVLPESARPFMGPNMYLTPGGFTSFHQDGHGTVDSGHTCMAGFNEVVMLRRLPEEHKLNAMDYLHRSGQRPMYNLPHESTKTDREIWPTVTTVEEWTRMNYCPSVFILTPGQHLHINKGRLHCFRKLTPEQLRPDDCHAGLREKLINELKFTPNFDHYWGYVCLSIAFDWMYLGITESGINEEVRSCLECAHLCKTQEEEGPLKCLAIPETTLLQLARRLARPNVLLPDILRCSNAIVPDPVNVCKGILPCLTAIVEREIASSKNSMTRALKPDYHVNAGERDIDPFRSASDYICKFCNAELSNTYYLCVGCKELLGKNLWICQDCYEGKKYHNRVRMHTINNKWFSDANHTGIKFNRRCTPKDCGCKQGSCRACGYCKACSCQCHLHFQQNQRFFTVTQLENDLKRIQRFIAGSR